MHNYRIYLLTLTGVLIDELEFYSSSDQAAVARLVKYDAPKLELWNGRRLVHRQGAADNQCSATTTSESG